MIFEGVKNPPFGYKWVVRYKNADGLLGMGITDHHLDLSPIITNLLLRKARNITITDESIYKDE